MYVNEAAAHLRGCFFDILLTVVFWHVTLKS